MVASSKKANFPDPSLKELMNLPISEWYPLGIQLGLEDYQLKMIRNSNAGLSNSCQQSTSDMFQKWLDSGGSSYTQLYKVLVKCIAPDSLNLGDASSALTTCESQDENPCNSHPKFCTCT